MRLKLFVLGLAVCMICGCAIKKSIVTKPILTPEINVAALNNHITNQQVAETITKVLAPRGWRVTNRTKSVIDATLSHNQETASISIEYSTQKIVIRYAGSTNLRYDGTKIHRGYNRWVKTLEVDISNAISALR